MIIGIDLDGVTGDYTGGLRRSAAKAYSVPELEIMDVFPEPDDYEFSNWKHIGGNFVEEHTKAVALGLFRDMEVMPSASEVLWKLDSDGHRLRVITSRFARAGQHHKVLANTAEWLDKHDIPYHDIMFTDDKVSVNADVYIDDAPGNISKFKAAGRNVIIYDALYNRHMGDDFRAYDWHDVYRLINTL